jgi:conjugative relaxase-like TrwC/TraI family protein
LSAPKSVSLAWALADEPLRNELADAHREAVTAAFSFLERVGGRARRGLGGRDGHVEAGLAIACFTHPASRELDPQLHTHGIVLNVAHGADERWTSLDSRTIYLHRRAAGVVYRAELRERVAALGGRWGALDRRGLSELEGISQETLRQFSRRRVAIEAALSEHGLSGRAASEAACLATRRDKVAVELEELREAWAERAGELGWDAAGVGRLLDGTDRTARFGHGAARAEEERLLGPQGLTLNDSAFTRDDALVAWADAHRQGVRLGELERLTDATLRAREVVDSALSSMRRDEIERLVESPPPYVTGLLGPEPPDRAKALRWRQGLIEIEDWRRSAITALLVDDPTDPWDAALGPPRAGWEGRRRRRVVANLLSVRRDLVVTRDESARCTAANEQHATTQVLSRATRAALDDHVPVTARARLTRQR